MMENNKGKTQYMENRRHRWLKIIYLKIDSLKKIRIIIVRIGLPAFGLRT